MADSGADCLDIIHQSRAIQQALKKFDEHVLHQHLQICVARDMKTHGLTSERAAEALLDTLAHL